MEIELQAAARKFGGEAVFSALNLHLMPGQRWAVLGGNGSGKSTLLKILYGALSLSAGSREHRWQGQVLSPEAAARKISYAAPYFELIEELSARDFLDYFQKLAPLRPGESSASLLAKAYLEKDAHKRIAQYSSGMKQRLRLALALLRDSAAVILDEPTANLDREGVAWYQATLAAELGERLLLVGTNYSEEEAFLCQHQIKLGDYK